MILLQLAIAKITADPRCQSRLALDAATVEQFVEVLAAGGHFPPLIVFWDRSAYWLADGFTRREAYLQRRMKTAEVEVKQGGLREAMLYAVSANLAHGLRPNLADRRHGLEMLLADPEWARWSDAELARRCGLHRTTVGDLRRIMRERQDNEVQVRRGGTVYPMRPRGRLEEADPEEQLARITEAERQIVCPRCGGEGVVSASEAS